jgi:CubicO group peptidase (beta-lactamase class C family)
LTAAVVSAAEPPWPVPEWPTAEPADVGMDAGALARARAYALTGGGSGLITRHGRAVLRWGDQDRRYGLKSTTKSIGVTALGLALADGKIDGLHTPARRYHPTFGRAEDTTGREDWLRKITLFHLATQTAGFAKPGGTGRLLFEPGTKWAYSDSGPNWLAECLTLQYRRDLRELLFERVFAPLGIKPDDLTWRTNAYRPKKIEGIVRREFGSGISANVDAMARIGYLYLRQGRWQGRRILPETFVDACRNTPDRVRGLPVADADKHDDASDHYGLLWWNNADGTLAGVPRDAYWSWGLYDSLIVVIPSLDIVAARAGKSWKREKGADHYAVLAPFLGPIATSVRGVPRGAGPPVRRESVRSTTTASKAGPPYPPSPVIRRMRWAPKETTVRLAKGSDNWPVTWADDGALYGAYGDGWGFEPRVERKLSLGLARILGSPPDVRGENLRSPSAEQVGDGARGRKASGMLMVGGVLYMAVRNADNACLAASHDRGRTWAWADWRFETGFGCPTFVNFGRDYAGARDGYVYLASPDSDSAYTPADRMVLARAPKGRLMDRGAWTYFERLNSDGRPVWTDDVARRGAVFRHPGRCYRGGVTYCAPLERYLWVQVLPGGDTRFRGGFGVYDAPEPWGPWTTAFFTERWDVGPGESASFPAKWMSDDGRTMHLVFSGEDALSVRKATLEVK